MAMFAPVFGQMRIYALPIEARYATLDLWDSCADGTSTPADKKSQKKLQNVFSSVSYRSTTAPNHELEGSVCLFLDLTFFLRLFILGG